MITYAPIEWADGARPAGHLLSSKFSTVYPSGDVEIGIVGTAGFSAVLTEPSSVSSYLSAPASSDAFGGEVLALQLNVDFSTLTGGSAGVPFGDLRLCNMSISTLNGMTVGGFLRLVKTLLGGGAGGYAINDLGPLIAAINVTFEGGAASTFAQQHLVNGACP